MLEWVKLDWHEIKISWDKLSSSQTRFDRAELGLIGLNPLGMIKLNLRWVGSWWVDPIYDPFIYKFKSNFKN